MQTATRLPKAEDGPKVLSREHYSKKWYPTDWSRVTKLLHAEWCPLKKDP